MKQAGFDDAPVLTGSITHLVGNQRIAEEKTRNFLRYRALYPECRFVFVGDNGQGDIDAGKSLTSERGVEAVFIHDIFSNGAIDSPQVPYRHAECVEAGLHLFQTYAGAAAYAATRGLIDPAAAVRVIEACLGDLQACCHHGERSSYMC